MTEQEKAADHEAQAGDIRNKLITRLAVAAVLVAVLLGVLAFFDYLSTAPDESEGMVFYQTGPGCAEKAADPARDASSQSARATNGSP